MEGYYEDHHGEMRWKNEIMWFWAQLWVVSLVISRLMAIFTNAAEALGVVSDHDGGWGMGPGASVEPTVHKL